MHLTVTTPLIALAFLAATANSQTALPPATSHPNTFTVHTTVVTTDPKTGAMVSANTPAILTVYAAPSSCPVDFRAQPGVNVGMVVIVSSDRTASQKLNLQFSNPAASIAIKHAQITVHGLTAHGRITPAAFGDTEASTLARQVDFALSVAPGASASADMLFKGFTSVQSIDLDSVTYADGSTWHASAQRTCQVVPNRFMLAASR